MPESILIFDVDFFGFTTKYIIPNIESLLCNIHRSFDNLESLPTYLWLLVIFAVWKMIERGEFFTIENWSLLPPGELSEYIVFNEERETLSFHWFESVVGRRCKL